MRGPGGRTPSPHRGRDAQSSTVVQAHGPISCPSDAKGVGYFTQPTNCARATPSPTRFPEGRTSPADARGDGYFTPGRKARPGTVKSPASRPAQESAPSVTRLVPGGANVPMVSVAARDVPNVAGRVRVPLGTLCGRGVTGCIRRFQRRGRGSTPRCRTVTPPVQASHGTSSIDPRRRRPACPLGLATWTHAGAPAGTVAL